MPSQLCQKGQKSLFEVTSESVDRLAVKDAKKQLSSGSADCHTMNYHNTDKLQARCDDWRPKVSSHSQIGRHGMKEVGMH